MSVKTLLMSLTRSKISRYWGVDVFRSQNISQATTTITYAAFNLIIAFSFAELSRQKLQ